MKPWRRPANAKAHPLKMKGKALAAALALGAAMLLPMAPAQAAGLGMGHFCARSPALDAAAQDRLLRLSAALRAELDASGEDTVLISRSGLDLADFGLRYSHAGVAWRDAASGAWQVRQLYYACEEQRPLLYDQGLAGFVLGSDRPGRAFVSVLRLPPPAARALREAALNTPLALQLLGTRYSANAYAHGLSYQNCNQWVVELMAAAWGALTPGPALRERAQQWLAQAGYQPEPVVVPSHWMMFAAGFVPLLHLDDHPEDDRYALRLRVSLPATLEAFAQARWPASQRLELCLDADRIVARDGPPALSEPCQAGPGDRERRLD